MLHTFVRKLGHGARLTEEDEQVLTDLARPVRTIGPRTDIVAEGSEPRFLPLVVDGWACRYKVLENGKRQVIFLYLPGDICEPVGKLPRVVAHPVGALTTVAFAPVSPAAVVDAARSRPRIEEALWWDLLLASAIEREHVVNLGRRQAPERMGHLFCELHLRLAMVGLVDGLAYDLPITQADLGDLLGLSAVHVNRSLQELRKSGLITLRGRRLKIHDLDELRAFSLFDAAYLHFAPR